MDDAQKKIVNALQHNKECLVDRNKLKSILSDVIPNDKMHINLLLNAYEEGILKKFLGTDITLALLQFIPTLETNYGISNVNANWAVSTWCYILGRADVGDALKQIASTEESKARSDNTARASDIKKERERYKLGFGVYKAGIDFPPGDIRITVVWKKGESGCQFFLGIGNNPDDLDASTGFADKIYTHVKDGQYIKLMTFFFDSYKEVYCEAV